MASVNGTVWWWVVCGDIALLAALTRSGRFNPSPLSRSPARDCRLGYPGIKLSLPTELVTGTCFLQLYLDHIVALQMRARRHSGNPTLDTLLRVMRALGVRLAVAA